MSPVAIVYLCSKTSDSLLGHHHHMDVSVIVTNTVIAFIIFWKISFYLLRSHKEKKKVFESM